MSARLSKWGSSLALRIPDEIVEQAHLQEGDPIEVSLADDGSLVIRPMLRPYSLDDLVAGITPENRHEETDWGTPAGKEAW